ncbi:MAG: Holliday junction branch migration protein RuvA [Fimbriimonadales bacterium]
MIVRISGELLEIGPNYAIVMAGGVGYQLFASERLLVGLPALGMPVDLHARQVVRENDISLYGFQSASERRLFDLLITASGLGPKLALSLLGTIREEGIIASILNGDSKVLTRAAGVGMKLAQKLCVELSDKIREESLLGRLSSGLGRTGDDVVEALISLGHKRIDAERAAVAAREEAGDVGPHMLIPLALKFASGK